MCFIPYVNVSDAWWIYFIHSIPNTPIYALSSTQIILDPLWYYLRVFSGAYLRSGNFGRETFNRNIFNPAKLLITSLVLWSCFCSVQVQPISPNSHSFKSSWSGVMPSAADFSVKRAAVLCQFAAVSSLISGKPALCTKTKCNWDLS